MLSGRFCVRLLTRVGLVIFLVATLIPGPLCAQTSPRRGGPTPAYRTDRDDFRVVDGRIIGPWWQGSGPGVVYFTGPHAQKLKSFEDVGKTVARALDRPYLEIHKEDMLPSPTDDNGILVYPDGTARVRLFLMAGGNSFYTMCDLAGISEPTAEKAVAERDKFIQARKIPQAAFRTGMNYVGTCGGFFTATSGYDVPKALFHGWGLWPGKVKNIGPSMHKPFPDVVFDPAQAKHPLLRGVEGGVLKNMYYNGGPIGVQGDVPDTEYFGKYKGGAMPELEGDWFLVAYKPSDDLLCGRCVIATGHPEVYHGDFLLAMARYAVARDYEVPSTAADLIEPDKPVQGVSGDGQVQYYRVIPQAGRRMTVTLTDLDENCDLYLRADLPPTFPKFDAKSAHPGTADERITIPATRAVTYFLGIHGKHTRPNGAKYTLTVHVE